MKYLVIDGMLNGTGIRDKYEGGYLSLDSLELPQSLRIKIKEWLSSYEQEHYNGFENTVNVDELDKTGIEIAKQIKTILNAKVEYFSSATMKEIIV